MSDDSDLDDYDELFLLQTGIDMAIERIEQQRDASRLAADDAAQSTYQQDLAAARGWAFAHALEIIRDQLPDNS